MSLGETDADGGADDVRSLDVEAVLAANRAFYDAFEAKDLDGVCALWEHSDRVQCTHPGWSILRGWDEVGGAWAALIEGPDQVQFMLTNERVEVQGDVAWLTLDEDILGDGGSTTVSTINLFARTTGGWKMVGHHGSAVMAPRSS